jgi:hypothetical protein
LPSISCPCYEAATHLKSGVMPLVGNNQPKFVMVLIFWKFIDLSARLFFIEHSELN